MRVFGRLKPGVSEQAAREDMTAIGDALAREYPATNKGRGVRVDPLRDWVIRTEVRLTSVLLLGVVGHGSRIVVPAAALCYLVMAGVLREYAWFYHTGLIPIYVLAVLSFTPCGDGWSLDRAIRIARGDNFHAIFRQRKRGDRTDVAEALHDGRGLARVQPDRVHRAVGEITHTATGGFAPAH